MSAPTRHGSRTDDLPGIAARREHLVARYASEHGLDEATVRERLDAVCRRLSRARVRSDLPVLVERGLRESLAAGQVY